jgi:3-hydroxyacyl-CoA dehydrogenase/enoyl-CoA hydratase/3-hydroxybutyryl-CoA epimerase
MIGAEQAVSICDRLTEKFGERFKTPELLRELAASGETFYGRFGPNAKRAA